MMHLDTILLSITAVVAPVVASLVTYLVATGSKRWRCIGSRRIPLWLIHNLYAEVFPDKIQLADGSYVFRGSYYQYKVVFKRRIAEPDAQIHDVVVYRKVRDDKL